MIEPLCRLCLEAGDRVKPATVADHIKPHRGNFTGFRLGQLRSLCADCPNRLDANNAPRAPVREAGRPSDPKHPWNASPAGHPQFRGTGRPGRTNILWTNLSRRVRRNRAGHWLDLAQIPSQFAGRNREIVPHLKLGPKLRHIAEIAAEPLCHFGAHTDLFLREPQHRVRKQSLTFLFRNFADSPKSIAATACDFSA